ncbi:murein biosynthesis integral membrane protein MurJ [Weizmannia agrestimuris]|uniref:murein biosynthesis integral membrane protein MurJ n=1 Tax=Weizmannia agrestimuris TaxID=2941342 RepID=UPI00203C8DC9|nr:murein biosynthesis integral membrane protein MurJ [Weizmannia agrestimuris]
MKKTGIAIIIVGLFTLISKFLGFIKDVFLAKIYGASYITDAYLTGTMIPNTIFYSVTGALSLVIIPLYLELNNHKGKDNALKFINNLLHVSLLVTIALSVIGVLFSKYIIGILGIGFDHKTMDLAIRIGKISFPIIIFLTLSQILRSYLQANKVNYAAATLGISNNIILIMFLLLTYVWGIKSLIYGTLIASIIQFVVQFLSSKKHGFIYKFYLNFKDIYVRKAAKIFLPAFFSVSIQSINIIIDRMLASGLQEGSISALTYADKLIGFIYGIFSLSVSNVIFPMISESITNQNYKRFGDITKLSLNIISILTIPISIGAMVLCKPIVMVVFERGSFDNAATQMTASALLYFSIGMVFLGYRDILNRAFYSFGNSKTPMFNGVLVVVLNALLSLTLVNFLGYKGIALGTSISTIICTILYSNSLKKLHKEIGKIFPIKSLLKVLVASIVMGISIYKIYFIYPITNNIYLNLFLTIFAGIIIYVFMLYMLKVKEFRLMIGRLKYIK